MRLVVPRSEPLAAGGLEDLYDPGELPSLRVGFVASADGAISVAGQSRGLQTESDGAAFRALRTVTDAVVVGAGTARKEDYGPVRLSPAGVEWRRAHGRSEQIPLVIISRSLDLDPAARFFTGGLRPIVITCAVAPVQRRQALEQMAEVLVVGDEFVDLPAAAAALQERGLTRLLCEGGPTLFADLLAVGCVDDVFLTLSPMLVGTGPGLLPAALAQPVDLELRSLVDGGDGALLFRWGVVRPQL
jgi:riboflavin biosynthesis pyrimidine reductase